MGMTFSSPLVLCPCLTCRTTSSWSWAWGTESYLNQGMHSENNSDDVVFRVWDIISFYLSLFVVKLHPRYTLSSTSRRFAKPMHFAQKGALCVVHLLPANTMAIVSANCLWHAGPFWQNCLAVLVHLFHPCPAYVSTSYEVKQHNVQDKSVGCGKLCPKLASRLLILGNLECCKAKKIRKHMETENGQCVIQEENRPGEIPKRNIWIHKFFFFQLREASSPSKQPVRERN